jgi:hypothetical protein
MRILFKESISFSWAGSGPARKKTRMIPDTKHFGKDLGISGVMF